MNLRTRIAQTLTRCVCLFVFGVPALIGVQPIQTVSSRHRAIQAYEIRPNLLVLPSYAADGTMCEAVVQRLFYSPGSIQSQASLSQAEIAQVVDELAPAHERGALLGTAGAGTGGGGFTVQRYQNVDVRLWATVGHDRGPEFSPADPRSVFAMVITWKRPACKETN